jgi:hypothetical protein
VIFSSMRLLLIVILTCLLWLAERTMDMLLACLLDAHTNRHQIHPCHRLPSSSDFARQPRMAGVRSLAGGKARRGKAWVGERRWALRVDERVSVG